MIRIIVVNLFLLLTLIAKSSFADSLIVLSEAIPLLNSEILHQELEKELKNNSFSNESNDLLIENSKLKDAIKVAKQVDNGSKRNCYDKEKNEIDNNPIDDQNVTRDNWSIVGSVMVNTQSYNNSIKRLSKTLPTYKYNRMYKDLKNITSKELLKEVIQKHTKDMNKDEYMGYLAEMTSRLPYNFKKSQFDQKQQGVDSLYSMIQRNDIGGICGDIHFATVLMGEATRGNEFEFYTASYVMKGSQHVYSFAIDKNNPKQAYIINYNRLDKIESINGADSLLLQNQGESGRMDNIGANLRIYKNTSSHKNGQAQHITTLPTPIGRYLNSIHLDENQLIGAPIQNQGLISQVNFSKKKTKIKEKESHTKIINISKVLKLAHGNILNANGSRSQVFTLLAKTNRNKNLSSDLNVLTPKRLASESNLSVSGNIINQSVGTNLDSNSKLYFFRLNYFNRYHKTLYRTKRLDVQTSAGYHLTGDFILQKDSATGDGNLETELAAKVKYKPSTIDSVTFGVKKSHAIGLKEQREVFQLNQYPSNIQMTGFFDKYNLKWDKKIGRNLASMEAEYVSSQVGGFKRLNAGYQINTQNNGVQHIISVNYTLPDSGINLLQTREQLDLGYGIKMKNFEAGAAIGINQDQKFFGGKIKLELGGKKRKKDKGY